jgi:hypothetical protein
MRKVCKNDQRSGHGECETAFELTLLPDSTLAEQYDRKSTAKATIALLNGILDKIFLDRVQVALCRGRFLNPLQLQ